MKSPELSIIVPVLNEAAGLSELFATLEAQRCVCFELILCDGGSEDETGETAEALGAGSSFLFRLIRSGRGRARQMNAGAREAESEFLLFLHADSGFFDPLALRRGLDAIQAAFARRGDRRAAGHFPLRFRRREKKTSTGYAFYEYKARLDRPWCTHGDQGFLMARSFFEEVGPYDDFLPLLEDTCLAEKIRARGEWVLLPCKIGTSARRFETEGFYERQVLNALIMNFGVMKWQAFFRAAPDVYRLQDRTGKLRLTPFLELIRKLTREIGVRERFGRWSATGEFVRANAWQLVVARDVRRQFRQGIPVDRMSIRDLENFDRRWDRLTGHAPGRLAAAALTWVWFRWLFRRRRRLETGTRHRLSGRVL